MKHGGRLANKAIVAIALVSSVYGAFLASSKLHAQFRESPNSTRAAETSVVWPVGTSPAVVGNWGNCIDGGHEDGKHCIWLHPTSQGQNSIWRDASPFGLADSSQKGRYHLGADFNLGQNDVGQNVRSIADGVIIQIDRDIKIWGNIVFVSHNINRVNYTSMYAHIDVANGLAKNQTVRKGQNLGTIAPRRRTFNDYSPHLHFELRRGTNIEHGFGWASGPNILPQGQIDPIRTIISLAARTTPAPRPRPTPTATPQPPRLAPPPPQQSPLPPPPGRTLTQLRPPMLQGPGSRNAVSLAPIAGPVQLTWAPSRGATGYEVEARDVRTRETLFGQTTTRNRVRADLPAGRTIEWVARACNPEGCSRDSRPLYFSTQQALQTPAPRPAPPPPPPSSQPPSIPVTPTATGPGATREPGPEQSGTRVTLQWNPVSRATEYDLGVRDLGTNRLVFDRRVSGTSQRITLEPGKRYRWNVAACNAAGCSRFTAPLFFRTQAKTQTPAPAPVPPPTAAPPPPPPPPSSQPPSIPVTPAATGPGSTREPGPEQSGTRVTLQWNPVSRATEYDLGVRDLGTNRLVFDRRVSGTSQRITLEPGKRYRWNVAACNAAGCSRFTAPLHFTMSNPSGGGGGGNVAGAVPGVPSGTTPGRSREPGQKMKIDSVTLQWSEVRGAAHYEVEVRDLAAKRNTTIGPLRQRFHIFKMKKGGTYRWSVRACNANGCSSWSERLFVSSP